MNKGIYGIMGFALGGAILVYILSMLIMENGFRSYGGEQGSLAFGNAVGGFVAFLLLGFGLLIILHEKPEIE